MTRNCWRFIALAACFIWPVASLSAADPTLQEVRERHAAALKLLETVSADYVVQQTLPDAKIMAQGRYSRSGSTVRIADGTEGQKASDFLLKNGESRSIARGWTDGKVNANAGINPQADFFSWGDIEREGLLVWNDSEGKRVRYDTVLDTIAPNAKLSSEKLNGRRCVRIDSQKMLNGKLRPVSIWHDTERNFLVVKEVFGDDTAGITTTTVTEFAEPAPGVYFPVKVTFDNIRSGKTTHKRTMQVTNLVVNQPIPDDTFRLPALPAGTRLTDTIRNTTGMGGPDWRPVGPTTPFERTITPEPAPAAPAEAPSSGSTQATQVEPASTGQFVLVVSLVVAIVCVGILVARVLRNRQVGGGS